MENLLIVEGPDDERVVQRIRERVGIEARFDIRSKGGIDPLLRSIGPEIKVSGRRALGILVDANDDPAARWQSIRDRLARVGTATPTEPEQEGTVIDGSPRLGIWLMPDNGSAGEIEDFVSSLIRPGDPLWPRAARYIDEIPPELRPFADGKEIRAKLYAWLATRKEPRRMGQAILAGDITTDHQSVTTFAQWLTRTFAASTANPPAAPQDAATGAEPSNRRHDRCS